MSNDAFRVPRGADKTYRLTALSDNVPIDLTGAKVYATVKTTEAAQSGGSALFRRRNTAAGGGDTEIQLLTQSGGTLGMFDLKFIPSNTSALTPGTGYTIDVWIIDAATKKYQIVAAAVFEVQLAVTTDFS